MFISEMCGGEPVRLVLTANGAKMEFKSTVVAIDDKKKLKALESVVKNYPYALVEAITKEDKVIGFPSSGVEYTVAYVDKESKKAFEWHEVTVKQVSFADGTKNHIFISEKNVKELNRRERYRLWLGCDGILQIGLNSKSVRVIIKDISATGVSFIIEDKQAVDGNMIPKMSTIIALSFSDSETNTKFKLNASVVRIEEHEDGRMFFGCRLMQESAAIAKFVNTKQRERNRLDRQ